MQASGNGDQMRKRIAIRLPDETHARLEAIAAKTGWTVTHYIRTAVEDHLQSMEDLCATEEALIEHRRSGEQTLSLAELDAVLALED